MKQVFHKAKFIEFKGIVLILRLRFYVLGGKNVLLKEYRGDSKWVYMYVYVCTHVYI